MAALPVRERPGRHGQGGRLEGYTEICLGFTEWTTGFGIAYANFYRNLIAPWSDMSFEERDITESADGVTGRGDAGR